MDWSPHKWKLGLSMNTVLRSSNCYEDFAAEANIFLPVRSACKWEAEYYTDVHFISHLHLDSVFDSVNFLLNISISHQHYKNIWCSDLNSAITHSSLTTHSVKLYGHKLVLTERDRHKCAMIFFWHQHEKLIQFYNSMQMPKYYSAWMTVHRTE